MAKNNLLSKAFSWFKKSEDESETEVKNQTLEVVKEQPALPIEPQPVVKAEVTPARAPTPTPAPAPAPVREPVHSPDVASTVTETPKVKVRRTEPEPAPAPRIIDESSLQKIFAEGPEIKIVTKGAKVYAVCPHCEATWNLKERLLVYSTKRMAAALTCPSCDKAISLPVSLNLKKLSSM